VNFFLAVGVSGVYFRNVRSRGENPCVKSDRTGVRAKIRAQNIEQHSGSNTHGTWIATKKEMVVGMMKMMKSLMIASLIAVGTMGSVQAATLDLTSVNGVWTGLRPNNGRTDLNGLGTSTVRWGKPFKGQGGNGEQSGYSFVGQASGTFESGVDFDLGTFTHFNRTINKGTSITGASLGLTVGVVIGGVSQAITAAFNFDHLETDNRERGGRCENGGNSGVGVNVNGCADRVRILNNSDRANQFVVNGITYILEITGFVVDGQRFTEFWTTERAPNSAILRARFTQVGGTASGGGSGGGNGGGGGGVDPTPSPVPLPGAAWLILSALGAMAFVGRKRAVV
jgi:hypothetical protein